MTGENLICVLHVLHVEAKKEVCVLADTRPYVSVAQRMTARDWWTVYLPVAMYDSDGGRARCTPVGFFRSDRCLRFRISIAREVLYRSTIIAKPLGIDPPSTSSIPGTLNENTLPHLPIEAAR
jgi:hypothetical protein